MSIRRAVPADIPTLIDLSRTTFAQTFAHLYDPADLTTFLESTYTAEALSALMADPAYAFWLLEEDGPGTAVGYTLAGPATIDHPDVAPGDGELHRLYLLRSHQGGGRGTALLTTALAWLLAEGPRTLWLGVWEHNDGAQRLYARHGFVRAGEHVFAVGGHADRDYVLRRPA